MKTIFKILFHIAISVVALISVRSFAAESMDLQICAAKFAHFSQLVKISVRGIGSDWNLPDFVDAKPPENPIGLISNLAAFVKTKEDGDYVVRMLNGLAKVSYRTNDRSGEPYHIQVKVGANREHLENLELLGRLIHENDGFITPSIITHARRMGKAPLRPTSLFIKDEEFWVTNTAIDFVDGAGLYGHELNGFPHGLYLHQFLARVDSLEEAQRVVKMANGLAAIQNRSDIITVSFAAQGHNLSKLHKLKSLVQEHGNFITEDIVEMARNYNGK